MFEKLFPANVHPIERALRAVVGVALLSLVFLGPKTLWGLLGIVPILTGLLGSCPAYTLLGWSTCRIRSRETQTT